MLKAIRDIHLTVGDLSSYQKENLRVSFNSQFENWTGPEDFPK